MAVSNEFDPQKRRTEVEALFATLTKSARQKLSVINARSNAQNGLSYGLEGFEGIDPTILAAARLRWKPLFFELNLLRIEHDSTVKSLYRLKDVALKFLDSAHPDLNPVQLDKPGRYITIQHSNSTSKSRVMLSAIKKGWDRAANCLIDHLLETDLPPYTHQSQDPNTNEVWSHTVHPSSIAGVAVSYDYPPGKTIPTRSIRFS